MKPLVTVIYEDSKIGKEFPLHKLVLRMVEDTINGQTWKLLPLVAQNPRNGIDKVLAHVQAAELTAGGGFLFVLADRDKIVRHINKNVRPGETRLALDATDAEVVAAVKATAGSAAERVRVFLLQPNMEGLIRAISECVPGRWSENIQDVCGSDVCLSRKGHRGIEADQFSRKARKDR
jgi:hypothetical protein